MAVASSFVLAVDGSSSLVVVTSSYHHWQNTVAAAYTAEVEGAVGHRMTVEWD